jgi:hypothetical protein
MVRESYWDYMGRRMREERCQTYVSSSIVNELYSRLAALEYRVSNHDQDINALDWEVRGENYEGPEQLEMDV